MNTNRNGRPPNHLPTLEQWRARIRFTVRALLRDAGRLRDLTLTQAPADLNTPHIDYMLRPSYVGQISESVTALATALYQIEVQARYRRHRPADRDDLTVARQHLTAAATALHRIHQRARGTNP